VLVVVVVLLAEEWPPTQMSKIVERQGWWRSRSWPAVFK
jgi:hypothetical protein